MARCSSSIIQSARSKALKQVPDPLGTQLKVPVEILRTYISEVELDWLFLQRSDILLPQRAYPVRQELHFPVREGEDSHLGSMLELYLAPIAQVDPPGRSVCEISRCGKLETRQSDEIGRLVTARHNPDLGFLRYSLSDLVR